MTTPRIRLVLLLPVLLAGAPFPASGAETEADNTSTSPDERWEYRLIESPDAPGDGVPVIFKAGTTKVVRKLSEEAAHASVVWSPNSRRFAFNYRAGGRYNTTELYQLRAGKWEALRSPEAPKTTRPLKRAMEAQARKAKLSKATFRRRIWDAWTIRRWVNANTAELHVSSSELAPESGVNLHADYLFTLRFDAKGRWTVVRTRALTSEESEAMDAE